MSRRRVDRKLHLELLRARAAADRIELSVAVRDIADGLGSFRRATDAVATVVGAVSGRGRLLGWVAALGAAVLLRPGALRRVLADVAAGRGRRVAAAALAAGISALVRRRTRRSAEPDPQSGSGQGDPTV